MRFRVLFEGATQQALGELVGIAGLRDVAEGGDGQIRRRTRIEAVDLRQAAMEVAGECKLFRLGRAECGDAGELQRKPQAHRAEVTGKLGRQVSGRRPDL